MSAGPLVDTSSRLLAIKSQISIDRFFCNGVAIWDISVHRRTRAQADIAIRRDRLFRLNLIVWRLSASANPIARNLARIVFHVELPKGTPRIRLPHPYMVVVNENTVIGENCTFYHDVTIGSRQFRIVTAPPPSVTK